MNVINALTYEMLQVTKFCDDIILVCHRFMLIILFVNFHSTVKGYDKNKIIFQEEIKG